MEKYADRLAFILEKAEVPSRKSLVQPYSYPWIGISNSALCMLCLEAHNPIADWYSPFQSPLGSVRLRDESLMGGFSGLGLLVPDKGHCQQAMLTKSLNG